MANRFDVVTVWVQNKCTVVVWMVVSAYAWFAIVAATCSNGSKIEGVNHCAACDTKCDVNGGNIGSATGKPEIWFRSDTKACSVITACDCCRNL